MKHRSRTDRMELELNPADEHDKLFEERKKDFLIAVESWDGSKIEENEYLKGKADWIVPNDIFTHKSNLK